MIVASDLETLQQAVFELVKEGRRIALVPTMGALHSGHSSLITLALQHADAVVASIFVNPTQFGANEDFSKYPRTLEDDIQIAKDAGATIIYAPSVEDMYPDGFNTTISAGKIGSILCGKFRPSHFDGVATVVTKLLLRIMPHVAVFGLKDYQQLCVIRQIVSVLDIPLEERIAAPIIREADGLAISSRNRYLSAEERKLAPLLYQTLTNLAKQIKTAKISDLLAKGVADLTAQGFKVEYLELCDAVTLEPLSELEDDARLLIAAWLGNTRLIDNIEV